MATRDENAGPSFMVGVWYDRLLKRSGWDLRTLSGAQYQAIKTNAHKLALENLRARYGSVAYTLQVREFGAC